MSEHTAAVAWQRGEHAFARGHYSRAHEWRFDGGAIVPASASPTIVRAPWSDPSGVDPEEALVAAASSCHMLWFLSLAADAGHIVESYDDDAVGTMGKFANGHEGIVEIVLRPRIVFGGERVPDAAAIEALHHAAHERCFIAHSVKSNIRVEARA